MRKVIYSMNVSLDGFIEGSNRELDWVIVDKEVHGHFNDQARAVDTFLYGRRMYELMANFWPTADTDPSAPEYVVEFARIWRDKPKIVFSKTLEQVEWNSSLIRNNFVEAVTKLKEQPGKDMALGGSTIASTFMRLGLIDEYGLVVHPSVLGSGTPFFPALISVINLRLVETRAFGSGVVYLRYQVKDEVPTSRDHAP